MNIRQMSISVWACPDCKVENLVGVSAMIHHLKERHDIDLTKGGKVKARRQLLMSFECRGGVMADWEITVLPPKAEEFIVIQTIFNNCSGVDESGLIFSYA